MTRNDKYYTPEIEDLFIGYKYEFYGMSVGGMFVNDPELNQEIPKEKWSKIWSKEEITTDPWVGRDIKSALEILKNGQMRVAYLSKEDIESLGWKLEESEISPTLFFYKQIGTRVYELSLFTTQEPVHIRISYVEKEFENQGAYDVYRTYGKDLYSGKCLSINELKKLLKWLSIQSDALLEPQLQ